MYPDVTAAILYLLMLFFFVGIAWLQYGEIKQIRAALHELLKLEREKNEREARAAALRRIG